MNEIELILNTEQFSLLQKLLLPYVELYQTVNQQYQQNKIKEISVKKEEKKNG